MWANDYLDKLLLNTVTRDAQLFTFIYLILFFQTTKMLKQPILKGQSSEIFIPIFDIYG
jgi:hypothetical protein